jgi:hypothetical protein
LSWGSTTDAPEELLKAFQALENAPVLCPAWPFARTGNDWANSPVAGGLHVGWLSDWSDFEIAEVLSDPTDWDFVAPLLVGFLSEPASTPLTGLVNELQFTFEENSEAGLALLPDAVSFSNGPALGDATVPKVFPGAIDWRSAPSGGTADVQIERVQLGSGRRRANIYYEQSAERPQDGMVTLNSQEEIAAFLRWFLDQRGSAGFHYVSNLNRVARLAAQAIAGTNSITLDDATQLGGNRFLELSRGETSEILRVTSIAGDVCTLSANLANTWPANDFTLVRLVMLARHARDTTELQFHSPFVAETRMAWREVPAEYTVAAGETRGTTIGKLPTKAWLYEVTLDWNGATEVTRITSFPADLTASAQTWTSRQIEHSELRHSIRLDRDDITLKVRWWSGSPFRKFLPNALDCKVGLKIYECTVNGSNGENVTQWFGGEITSMPEGDGPILSFRAAGANSLFDRRALKFIMQPGCNDELFGTWCGLALEDWEISAEVFSVAGKVVTLENFSRSGGLPDGFGFEHWFALGYLQRADLSQAGRHIIFDSAAIDVNDRIAITLGAAVTSPAFVVGEDVIVVPGCDNRPETCKAYHVDDNPTGKFNNFGRFAGLPEIPDKNPAFQPLKQSDSNHGKK